MQVDDPAPRDPLLSDGRVYRMVIEHQGQHQERMLQSLDLQAEGGGPGGSRWPGGCLVESEPLDDDGAWLPVPENHVVRTTADGLTIEAVSW